MDAANAGANIPPQSTGTLFVGVGGTGFTVLREIKSALLDIYGKIDPQKFRFLAIDTYDPNRYKTSKQESAQYRLNPNHVGRPLNDPVLDLDNEYFWLSGNFRATNNTVLDNGGWRDEENGWLNARYFQTQPSSVFQVDAGAGQYRQVGRVALRVRNSMGDYNYGDLNARINSAIALNPGGLGGGRGGATVVIVSSLVGGTGAGSLIDIASLINSRQNVRRLYVSTLLVTHGAMKATVGSDGKIEEKYYDRVYAGLREIRRFQTAEGNEEGSDIGKIAPGERLLRARNPLGVLFLIDSQPDSDANAIGAVEQEFGVVPAVSDLALLISDMRVVGGGFFDDMTQYIDVNWNRHCFNEGRMRDRLLMHLVSIGSYIYPWQHISRKLAAKFIKELFGEYLFAAVDFHGSSPSFADKVLGEASAMGMWNTNKSSRSAFPRRMFKTGGYDSDEIMARFIDSKNLSDQDGVIYSELLLAGRGSKYDEDMREFSDMVSTFSPEHPVKDGGVYPRHPSFLTMNKDAFIENQEPYIMGRVREYIRNWLGSDNYPGRLKRWLDQVEKELNGSFQVMIEYLLGRASCECPYLIDQRTNEKSPNPRYGLKRSLPEIIRLKRQITYVKNKHKGFMFERLDQVKQEIENLEQQLKASDMTWDEREALLIRYVKNSKDFILLSVAQRCNRFLSGLLAQWERFLDKQVLTPAEMILNEQKNILDEISILIGELEAKEREMKQQRSREYLTDDDHENETLQNLRQKWLDRLLTDVNLRYFAYYHRPGVGFEDYDVVVPDDNTAKGIKHGTNINSVTIPQRMGHQDIKAGDLGACFGLSWIYAESWNPDPADPTHKLHVLERGKRIDLVEIVDRWISLVREVICDPKLNEPVIAKLQSHYQGNWEQLATSIAGRISSPTATPVQAEGQFNTHGAMGRPTVGMIQALDAQYTPVFNKLQNLTYGSAPLFDPPDAQWGANSSRLLDRFTIRDRFDVARTYGGVDEEQLQCIWGADAGAPYEYYNHAHPKDKAPSEHLRLIHCYRGEQVAALIEHQLRMEKVDGENYPSCQAFIIIVAKSKIL